MNSPLIAICAATYQRPKMLAMLIESLRALEINDLRVHLIIADNDIAESAREIVESTANSLPFPTTYVAEPSRGLATVRNRLVAEAQLLGADFIAFIDDDETAHPQWLMRLLEEAFRSGAAAVAGRNVSWLDEDIPSYIKECFPNPNQPSGKTVPKFGTGNALVRTAALKEIPGPFDVRLNLTGGEDSMLSARLRQKGFKITYCNEAETYGYVPRSRANPKWITKRAFRSGITRSKIVRWSDPSLKDVIIHVVLSLGIIAKHATLMIPNLITRRDLLLFRVRCIVSGIGGIAGTVTTRAYAHQEYETTHGE